MPEHHRAVNYLSAFAGGFPVNHPLPIGSESAGSWGRHSTPASAKLSDVERGVQVPVVMHPVLGTGPLPDFEGQIDIPVELALVPPQHAILSW